MFWTEVSIGTLHTNDVPDADPQLVYVAGDMLTCSNAIHLQEAAIKHNKWRLHNERQMIKRIEERCAIIEARIEAIKAWEV